MNFEMVNQRVALDEKKNIGYDFYELDNNKNEISDLFTFTAFEVHSIF